LSQVHPRFGDATDASESLRYVLVWYGDGETVGHIRSASVERYDSERDVILAAVALVQHWVS
jgi:hypothetical protein